MKNRTFFYPFFFILFFYAHSADAQFEKDKARSRVLQIDQLALDANLRFEPEQGVVRGEVSIKFKNSIAGLDSIWLDAIKVKVEQAYLDRKRIKYKVFEKGLAFFPDSALVKDSFYSLAFAYEASPKRGMYFLGWNDTTGLQRKQIWTQGQGIDNRHWLPHVDAQNDKLLIGLDIEFDEGYEVISNGKLFEKTGGYGVNKWKYRMEQPMSSYLLMIAIGEYEFLDEKSKSEVELKNYYYPDWKDRNEWTYYKSTELFNWMESEIGVPYPWQNYKQVPVKDFQHGAMENTTATIFGDFYCVDDISFNDDNYVGVNAHELAHQWFGNSVTALSSHDHWLHEGFATYYSWLAEKEIFGDDRFKALLLSAEAHIIQDNLQNEFPLHHSRAGSVKFYEQGAWTLNMLKHELGDEAFKASMKVFLEKYAYKTATTNNLIRVCEKESSQDLTQFFEQWLERPNIPNIKITASYNEEEANFSMHLEQTQKVNSHMPEYNVKIPFVIYTDLETYTYETTLGNVSKNLNVALSLNEKIKYIEVDPDATVLASWDFDLPTEWKVNQLNEGESHLFSTRVLRNAEKLGFAEISFEDLDSKDWPDYLQKAWIEFIIDNENFSEKFVSSQVEEASLAAKKAYLAISQIPKSHEKMVRSWLKAPSYELQEQGLLKLFLSFRDNGDTYLKLTKGVDGTRGHNVKVMWEFVNIINAKGAASADEIIRMTSAQYDFLTRLKSLEVIDVLELPFLNEALLTNLFEGVFQGNRKWRSAAIAYLRKCNEDPSKQKAIFAFIEAHKTDWQDWQITRVENTFSIKIEK